MHSYKNLCEAWSFFLFFILFRINCRKEWSIEIFFAILIYRSFCGGNLFPCRLGGWNCFTGLLSFEEIVYFISFSWLLFDSNFALRFEECHHSFFFLKTKIRIRINNLLLNSLVKSSILGANVLTSWLLNLFCYLNRVRVFIWERE